MLRDHENSIVYWRELSTLWKQEHDCLMKITKKLSRRMKWEVKNYGKVQDETIEKLSQLTKGHK